MKKTILMNCLAFGAYGVGAAVGMCLVFGACKLIEKKLREKKA